MAYANKNVVPASARDVGLFSSTELRAIELGERADASREIAARGYLGRFIECVLGARLPRPLADPRLETLRLFASLVRHHCDRVMDADVARLIDAGYSPGQAYGLLDYLGRRCRSA